MISWGKILLIICVAIAVEAVCVYLNSNFLIEFLKHKIVELLVTLLAINTATSSFIVSKLQDIGTKYNISFKGTYKEVKFSLVEQIVLIGLSIITLIIESSISIESHLPDKVHYLFDVVLIFCFVYAIDILRDTGVAMFNILIELEKDEKEK